VFEKEEAELVGILLDVRQTTRKQHPVVTARLEAFSLWIRPV
jgi:hypothetical protein